jgi:signal transduction histidine kinase
MPLSAMIPAWHNAGQPPPTSRVGPARWLWRDRLLLSACTLCVLLIAFQLSLTLFHPAWGGAVTDWIGEILAWPELLVLVYASLQLSRAHWRGALAWWMWSAALLFYAIGHTVSRAYDPLNFSRQGPFPTLPSVLYLLQYPFFFLAVILLPKTSRWESRLIMFLDGLLLMGGAVALSWYFILAPMYIASGMSRLERTVSVAFALGDLTVLFGLSLILLRPSRYAADRLVLCLLVVAIVCLIVADSWAAWHLLTVRQPYTTSNPSDLFWVPSYLLIPLAGLVQLRLVHHESAASRSLARSSLNGQGPQRPDVIASLRLFLPIVVAVLASVLVLMRATTKDMAFGWRFAIDPLAVSCGLLLLIIMRQGIVFLENAQLRRDAETARANEAALRELDRRKDEFLSIVSHELKTPLTSLQGYAQLLAHRFTAWRTPSDVRKLSEDALARDLSLAHTAIAYSEGSIGRIAHLVNDLLDDSRIHDGRLALELAPCELGAIVRDAVAEQRMLAPQRVIRLTLPSGPVPVRADALRIGQVVTNYLTNALKYSTEDQPVAVGLAVAGGVARVTVRDQGPGVPASEQEHIWERFYRVEGIAVQSGSGVGLGLGLHISKTIVEQHGGQVGVESAPGQGSTFWFTVPLAGSE